MKLSIIVIFQTMRREARRTLHSLGPRYQTGVPAEDYEVIAIDNGSAEPIGTEAVESQGPNFRHVHRETDEVSPAGAVNAGADMARGEAVAVIVDGARMATPGLVSMTLKGLQLFPEPFVCALSWHLGPDIQGKSMLTGYDQAEEDRLLAGIGWPSNGYRLFEIATLAPSSGAGFLTGVPTECSWFAMKRATFLSMGGFEPRFVSHGGGRMNHDFRDRAMRLPGVQPVVLLGEGVFHQFHGGVTTNVPVEERDARLVDYWAEYHAIRGKDAKPATPPAPFYLGTFPPAARAFLKRPVL